MVCCISWQQQKKNRNENEAITKSYSQYILLRLLSVSGISNGWYVKIIIAVSRKNTYQEKIPTIYTGCFALHSPNVGRWYRSKKIRLSPYDIFQAGASFWVMHSSKVPNTQNVISWTNDSREVIFHSWERYYFSW